MGAFFIYDKDKIHNPNLALDMFVEMGFSTPITIEIGVWKIYAYPKMALSNPNTISNNGYVLVSAGTPIYKGLDYANSLASLLLDFQIGKIDMKQLIGQYTILFCHDDCIEVLCDPLGSKHLFTDNKHSMLSSHMLPVAQCFDDDIHINRKAIYEKFLTGIIMTPNTIFEEIIQIDKSTAECINHDGIGIKFIQTDSISESETCPKGLNECLAEQAENLQEYFQLLSNSGKDGIDIGLSGGYDSRLVLACLNRFSKGKIHLHSHATENDHQKELSIAKKMADYVGVPCHVVNTKKLSHCSHVDEVLQKSILYFDGRSSFSIGGCGEVYTASYRKDSTEKIPFTISGVGGELYRNIFDIGFRKIRFDHFIDGKVFSQSFQKAMPDGLFRETRNEIIRKAAARLEIDPTSRQSKKIAHRYYCEIMMPDGQGVALDAYNQVSCCIAPFLEPRIIAKGYEAIPYHCSGGEFEGKLINLIDSGLAAIWSIYGYPIGKRPLRAKVKERLRTVISTSVWDKLANGCFKKKNLFSMEIALRELYANSQVMEKAFLFLTELLPEINFTYMLRRNEDIRRVQFIAMVLYKFRERIKMN